MKRVKIRSSISIAVGLLVLFSLHLLSQPSRAICKIDKSAILLQLQKQSFDQLNSKLEEYQQKYEKDYQTEDCVFDAFEAFRKADPAYELILQNWAAQYPNLYAPYVARAEYYCAAAVKARGKKRVVEKDQKEYKEMEQNYLWALNDIDQALKINPQLDVCYAMRIDIGKSLGNNELVMTSLLEASKYHPYGCRVKLKYVQTMSPRNGGSYEKMEGFVRSYEKTAANFPKMKELNAAVPAEKGSTFYYLGKYDQAVLMYTEALKYSQNHSYYADRGDAYTRMNNFKLAFADYNRALELSPKDPDYLDRKAQAIEIQNQSKKISIAQGNVQQSNQDYEWPPKRSSESESREASEHSSKGYNLLMSGQYEKAAVEYSETIRLNPDRAVPYYNRGICYMQMHEYDAAIQDFTKNIELDRDNIITYFRLSTVYANKRMYDEAINTINAAINIQPGNAEAYYTRGRIYVEKGMNVEGVEDIRKACKMGFQKACQEYKINE